MHIYISVIINNRRKY